MKAIARCSDDEKRGLFRNTADKMGMNDAIVEKDFWVCFTLDYLFRLSPWKEAVTFKGGTSLSKAFHLISRYSRHYYDLYRMANTPVKDAALSQPDLLKKVADFKMKFYPRAWAQYAQAVPGSLRLMPPEYRMGRLAADYDAMRDMLFGEIPSFASVIEGIRTLERQINSPVTHGKA